jgi:hypothetical protein
MSAEKIRESMTARTQHWDAQTSRLGNSPAARQYGLVTLASGREVTVDHGQDFATLIRADASR